MNCLKMYKTDYLICTVIVIIKKKKKNTNLKMFKLNLHKILALYLNTYIFYFELVLNKLSEFNL